VARVTKPQRAKPSKGGQPFDAAALSAGLERKLGIRSEVAINLSMAGDWRSGLLAMDAALGGQGLPYGAMVHCWGDTQTGKTALAFRLVAQFQALHPDGVAVLALSEKSLPLGFASAIGADLARTIIVDSSTGSGESYLVGLWSAIEKLSSVLGPGKVIGILDSVASLTPQYLLDNPTAASMGVHARMMATNVPKLRQVVVDTKSTMILMNQVRNKIGVQFGSPEIPPGGQVLKHECDVRMRFRAAGKLYSKYSTSGEGEGDPIGIRVHLQVDKSRVGSPFRRAWFDVYFFGHVTDAPCMCQQLDEYGVLERPNKTGGHRYFGGVCIGNGELEVNKAISADPVLRDTLFTALVAKMHSISDQREAFFSTFAGEKQV